jgi:hypothetical protein
MDFRQPFYLFIEALDMHKLLLTLLLAAAFSHAQTVRSLSKVAGQIHSPEIMAHYQEQINGTAKLDGFGYLAKSDQTTVNALLSVIAPQHRQANWGLIGLKPWRDDLWIATACAAEQVRPQKSDSAYYDECTYLSDDAKSVMAVALVRRSGNGFELAAEPWIETTQLSNPEQSTFSLTNHMGDLVIGDPDRLDLASYTLNEQTRAFGLRYSALVGYSGGGAMSQAMTLFAVIDGKLKPVLSVSTFDFEDLAGDWNRDGTRQHHVESAEYVLVMDKTANSGFRDIIWREKGAGKKQQKKYRWDAVQKAYR